MLHKVPALHLHLELALLKGFEFLEWIRLEHYAPPSSRPSFSPCACLAQRVWVSWTDQVGNTMLHQVPALHFHLELALLKRFEFLEWIRLGKHYAPPSSRPSFSPWACLAQTVWVSWMDQVGETLCSTKFPPFIFTLSLPCSNGLSFLNGSGWGTLFSTKFPPFIFTLSLPCSNGLSFLNGSGWRNCRFFFERMDIGARGEGDKRNESSKCTVTQVRNHK